MSPTVRVVLLTLGALIAFAANSLLCRAALGFARADAFTFTVVRLAAGALTLVLLAPVLARPQPGPPANSSAPGWAPAVALFAYAAAFSLAYRSLDVGAGALLLFGAVQVTMLLAAWIRGERPAFGGWIGIALALAGLVALTLPGLSAPDPRGSALMALAGIAWGVYSLLGRGATDPIATTTSAFVRAVPLAFVLIGIALLSGTPIYASRSGFLLAAASGSLASGLGYCLWYAALPRLRVTQAAVVQLATPVLAGLLGAVLLGERPSLRLVLAGSAILGGILIAIASGSGPTRRER